MQWAKAMVSSGIEPETFRVLGECDNRLHHETIDGKLGFVDESFTHEYQCLRSSSNGNRNDPG